MGTIETYIDLEKELTVHTASGEISADEILGLEWLGASAEDV